MQQATIQNDHTAPLGPEDQLHWDRYVLAHPQGTVFQRPAWSWAVEQAYGHQPQHLGFWRGGRLAGVLPLFRVKSPLAGVALVSLPYATYGGILADDLQAAGELLRAAEELGRLCQARYLELRHRQPSGLDLPDVGRYDTFRKMLPEDPVSVLSGLPRKTRAACRNGLEELGNDCAVIGPDQLETIYDLYSITLRRLGSPNYRRGMFRAVAEAYAQNCLCMVVRDGSRPLAGVLSLVFRDELVPYFSGSLEDGMVKHANNVMYLKLMEFAVAKGLRWFDFNRTRRDNQGPYNFKRHFGFEPAPLHYQVRLLRGSRMPNLSPSNRTFALAGAVWRRLPLWVTRPAGAAVSKWIP